MHFCEPPRTGMPRGGCPDPSIIMSPHARECPDPLIFVSPAHIPSKTVSRGVSGSLHFYVPPRPRGPRNLHFYVSGRGEAPKPIQRSDPGGRSAPPRLRRPGTRKNAGKKAPQGDENNGSIAPAPPRVNILNHTILYDPSLIIYIPTNPHASSPSPGAADSNGLRPLPPPPGNTISMQSVKEVLRITAVT